MARFAPAAAPLLALSAALAPCGGGAALGQTVADYEAALAAAPITAPVAGPGAYATVLQDEAYCRVLLNYVLTSIPASERYGLLLPLVSLPAASNPVIARKRAICEEERRQPVIQFNAGTGEEIVTPPQMTDGTGPATPYGAAEPRR